jgi:hypothetical protein
MGIVKTKETPKVLSPAAKRKSGTLDFGSLKPLNAAAGTKNFGGYRETSPKSKKKSVDAMDSEADDEDDIKVEDVDDDKDVGGKGMLSPDSAEPLGPRGGPSATESSASPLSGTPAPDPMSPGESSSSAPKEPSTESLMSPFKKQRASLPGFDDNVRKSLGQALLNTQKERGNSEGNIPTIETKMEEDDEL